MTELLGPSGMAEIREDILTDIANEAAKAGIVEPIGVGSDNYVKATGIAGALMFCHARVDAGKEACTPLGAQGPDLVRFKEAYRLPDVGVSRAAGKVTVTVTGAEPALVPNGQPGTIKGARFEVINGPWSGVANGDDVDVIMTAGGAKGNAKAGTAAKFLNPPPNVSTEAKVSKYAPIVGGYDAETPERLRARILNRTGTTPGGGNWGQLREICFNASPAVQQSFVYPAIGGPATDKTIVLKAFDRDLFNFSREFPEGAQTPIRGAIHAVLSGGYSGMFSTAADESVDVALQVTLPNSTLTGGNGLGWADSAPWPPLEGGNTRVSVTAINPAGLLTVNAATTTAPIPSQTRVSWWSPHEMRFLTRTITAVSGSAGAWALTLDAPFVDAAGELPSVGDYVSPAAENLEKYGRSWVNLMEQLGPGENTADSDLLLNGRALRHPIPAEGIGSALNIGQLTALKNLYSEIEDAAYSYRSQTAPTVPANVELPPNVLVPRHFGIYPQ